MISIMQHATSCDIIIDTHCLRRLAAKNLLARTITLSAITFSDINHAKKMDTDLDNTTLFDICNAVSK